MLDRACKSFGASDVNNRALQIAGLPLQNVYNHHILHFLSPRLSNWFLPRGL